MMIYAVDPGTLQSALVVLSAVNGRLVVRESATALNAALLPKLEVAPLGAILALEQFQAMGMPIGNDSIETVFWSGRFYQAWPHPAYRYLLSRRAIKLHLCGSMQANDATVRTALLDRFGPGRDLAIGTIKRKGPLYGLKGHEFAALAVGMTWFETRSAQPSAFHTSNQIVGAKSVAAAE